MRISDWSSDVCSSDLELDRYINEVSTKSHAAMHLCIFRHCGNNTKICREPASDLQSQRATRRLDLPTAAAGPTRCHPGRGEGHRPGRDFPSLPPTRPNRLSEEHTSELQQLMRISYAVFRQKQHIT